MRHFILVIVGSILLARFSVRQSAVRADESPMAQSRPRLVAQLSQPDPIAMMAFSGDGKWLASGTETGTVQVWEVATGRLIRLLATSPFPSTAFSHDGKLLAVGGATDTIRVWNIATGKIVRSFPLHDVEDVNRIAFSGDGEWLASRLDDETVQLWNVNTGEKVRTFAGYLVAMSNDGQWLLTASEDKVCVWELATGKRIRAISKDEMGYALNGIGRLVSKDAAWFLAGDAKSGKPIRLLETATGKEIRGFSALADSKDLTDEENSWTVSRDGKTLVSISLDDTVRLCNLTTGKQVHAFNVNGNSGFRALSGDCKWLAVSGTDGLRLWDVATGKEIRAFEAHAFPVNSAAMSGDGKRLVTDSGHWIFRPDITARLWDLTSGTQIRAFNGQAKALSTLPAVALNEDGKYLITSADNVAHLWETDTGKKIWDFKGHLDQIYSLALAPDGKTLATAGRDGTARLWNLASGQEMKALNHCESEEGRVFSVAFSSDGKWLVSGGSDWTVRRWEVATGKQVRAYKTKHGQVVSLALSGDAKWLVTGGANAKVAGNGGGAELWDVFAGGTPAEAHKQEKLKQAQAHLSVRTFCDNDPVHSTVLSLDGKLLVTGSQYDPVRLWDASTGKQIRAFPRDSGWGHAVTLTADAKRLVTTSSDGTTRFWELATGKELCRLASFRDGTWAVFDADGRFDAANNGDVKGMHWVVGMQTFPLSRFKDRFYDPGLLAKYLGHNEQPLRKLEAIRE